MTTVQRLLQSKRLDVWSIALDASVYDAVRLMAEKNVGALMVVDGDRLVGIISARDYAREIVWKDRSSRDTPVSAIMTRKVHFVRPDQTTDACMALTSERHGRHLPVLDDDRQVGVISMRDMV